MRIRYSFSSRRTGLIDGKNDHSIPFPKIAREVIKTSDIILEILDARFIEKTRNAELEETIKAEGKKLIYVLNKSDLIDFSTLKKNVDLSNLNPYVFVSCKSKKGRANLRKIIKIEAKRMKVDRKVNVGIIGYPNTGKSSISNLLVGRKSSGTSPQSGYTKGIQKIKLRDDILLLDTPGVIPDQEYAKSKESLLNKHTQIGVRTYDKTKDPDIVVNKIMQENPNLLENYYKISANGDCDFLLEELGRRNHFLKKGNEINTDRAARVILRDWQEGKITINNYKSKKIPEKSSTPS